MDLQTLSATLRDCGVVGAGGAGFPTYAKLNNKADTILLNCAECEPLLQLHQQLLAERSYEILSALQMVATAMDVSNVVICIKEEYQNTLQAVEQQLLDFPNIQLKTLASVYPTGDEVVLIYEATNRVVPAGGLPIAVGVVVFNVETMYNIYGAVQQNRAVTDKLVTVTGEVTKPITVRVPLGMTVRDVVALAGECTVENPAYLLGGPMMGTVGSGYQPITKTTNAILVLPADHQLIRNRQTNVAIGLKRAASACCQCQSCTDLCPRHALGHPIQPHLFMRAAANHDTTDRSIFLNTLYCSGCGICEEYACPQSLMPRTLIAAYKDGLRKSGVKVQTLPPSEVSEQRAYRTVPELRLASRVGLQKYHGNAPLDNRTRVAKQVTVVLQQHIGAPAVPVVEVNQLVKRGQLLAKAVDQALGVAIHASISGVVMQISARAIVIDVIEG